MSIETVALPSPIYGCACRGCAEEVSHSADDLFHYDGSDSPAHWPQMKEGFYCDDCLEHYDLYTLDLNAEWDSLASVIARRGLSR